MWLFSTWPGWARPGSLRHNGAALLPGGQEGWAAGRVLPDIRGRAHWAPPPAQDSGCWDVASGRAPVVLSPGEPGPSLSATS